MTAPGQLKGVLDAAVRKARIFYYRDRARRDRQLSLPMYPELPLDQVEEVADAIREFLRGSALTSPAVAGAKVASRGI